MKKLIVMSAIVLGGLGIKTADAQIGIRVNLHLGLRPAYVPAPQPVVVDDQYGYDDDYYYLPEVDAYYNVNENCYYYQDGDRWISAAYLPGAYRNYDWRSAQRYEIRATRPYLRADFYRERFRGNVNRNFYADRDRFNHDQYRGREQYDNRGWGGDNRGGYDRREEQYHTQPNGYPNQERNQGGYNQPQMPQRNNGGYGQQNQGQGGYSQPNQGSQHNQGGYNQNQNGGYNQQGQGRNGGSQPAQGQGSSQPAGHNNGGHSSYNGSDHFAQNNVGVVQDRGVMGRPVRF